MLAEFLHHREMCVFPGVVFGSRMPAHPPSMPRLALAGKPRGVVAIGAGRDYIWAMDEKELDEFAKRFLGYCTIRTHV